MEEQHHNVPRVVSEFEENDSQASTINIKDYPRNLEGRKLFTKKVLKYFNH